MVRVRLLDCRDGATCGPVAGRGDAGVLVSCRLSPAGEAKRHFHECLFARTDEHRRLFRAGIVNTTLEDLKRVTETYLRPECASTAVVTHTGGAEALANSGITLTRQDLL